MIAVSGHIGDKWLCQRKVRKLKQRIDIMWPEDEIVLEKQPALGLKRFEKPTLGSVKIERYAEVGRRLKHLSLWKNITKAFYAFVLQRFICWNIRKSALRSILEQIDARLINPDRLLLKRT